MGSMKTSDVKRRVFLMYDISGQEDIYKSGDKTLRFTYQRTRVFREIVDTCIYVEFWLYILYKVWRLKQ